MDSSPAYRVGVIGCGAIAMTSEDEVRKVPGYLLLPYSHGSMYARHPRTTIVAAADIDRGRLDAFGDRFGVGARYTDYRAMLAAEQLDVVSIAASTRQHHPMTLEATRHPIKGIFLEKPVARTLREADAMIDACERAGIKVVVNHFRTFDPYYRAAKDAIESGEIGELEGVLSTWHQGYSQGGSHLFDLLRYVIGARVDWVFGHTDEDPSLPDPGGDAYLVFANGVRALVHMPFHSVAPAEVNFVGTAGRITLGSFEGSRRFWKFVDKLGRTVPVESPFPVHLEGESGMSTALKELLRAIETGEEPASTLRHGRDALEIMVALLKSGRSRQLVQLPVDDPDFLVDSWL